MEFRLLGPLEVIADGRSLALGGPKPRALLALLLVHAGKVVAREQLIEELWRGEAPPGADITLRSYVSRLRTALGPARLQRQPPGYRLVMEPEELDARRFERLAHRGGRALLAGRAGEAAELLREAVSLWRGPAACDVTGVLPPQSELARLTELRVVAIEDRLEAELRLGHAHELVGELEGLVAEHPLRERLWGQLMRSLYHADRQAEALQAYRRAREVLTGQLGLEPGRGLQDLQLEILRHELPRPRPREHPPHNLPAEMTTFVGRRDELADLADLVRRHRLVTVVGLGGVGKTRLALNAARHAVSRYEGGVRFVELASLSDPGLLTHALADAVGVDAVAARSPLEVLCRRLRAAELLIVVDNCEHLLDAIAGLLTELLKSCPGVRVLATSREAIKVEGEAIYQLAPLEVSAGGGVQELADSAPVRLFLDRAALTGRRVPKTDIPIVGRICRELDGLPLAIELAAARTATQSSAAIAARLNDRFRFLRNAQPFVPARHQTLRAAMDWSYELLSEAQQRFLRHLAVFNGGFTLQSAAALSLERDQERALDLIEALAAASLIIVAERNGDTRYRLLETVRQYAITQLEHAGEREELSRRHLSYMLALARSAHLSAETEQAQRYDLLLPDQDNARAAIEHALRAGEVEAAAELAIALENFWVTRNPFEGMRWFERVLDREHLLSDLQRARALRAYGSSTHIAGDYNRAQRLYEQSLAGFRALGDQRATALVLHRLGLLAVDLGEPERARPLLEESLDLSRRSGSRRGEAQALGGLGVLDRAEGNIDRAIELFELSATMSEELGRVWWQSSMLANLAEVALEAGRIEQAAGFSRRTLALAHEIRDRQTAVRALAYLASGAAATGDARRAGQLWAAILTEERHGDLGATWASQRQLYAARVHDTDQADFELGLRQGSTLTFAQAVRLESENGHV